MTESTVTKQKEIPGNFEIKKATENDLPTVWRIIKKNADDLSRQGIHHWEKYYTEEMVSKMIRKKEVYLGLNNSNPVGTVTFDSKPPKYYAEPGYGERFTSPEDLAIYITALAVLPDEQHHGFASKMLQFVEDEAIKRNINWLRLDCRAEVPGLVIFYERRGFVKVNEEPINEGEDGTYFLMEKSLQ